MKKRLIHFVKNHLDGELTITTNIHLCSNDFTPDSFTNFHQRQLGFADNPLLLVNGTEPTISHLHPPVPLTTDDMGPDQLSPVSAFIPPFFCGVTNSEHIF